MTAKRLHVCYLPVDSLAHLYACQVFLAYQFEGYFLLGLLVNGQVDFCKVPAAEFTLDSVVLHLSELQQKGDLVFAERQWNKQN